MSLGNFRPSSNLVLEVYNLETAAGFDHIDISDMNKEMLNIYLDQLREAVEDS